eukprot:3161893-Rhodomonas_salina.3
MVQPEPRGSWWCLGACSTRLTRAQAWGRREGKGQPQPRGACVWGPGGGWGVGGAGLQGLGGPGKLACESGRGQPGSKLRGRWEVQLGHATLSHCPKSAAESRAASAGWSLRSRGGLTRLRGRGA